MKKLKLTEVQKHQVKEAFNNASTVLQQIKRVSLEGEALKDMKTLEGAVQHLECFLITDAFDR